ncbi:dihydroxyacetone kinase subunit DhaL [Saccharothrix violaceirubra]|uniref:dihydroxyacetone kinase subunit DhaL n=1 Tax=Saccharothrix violaceirubra TaxID=413306 RepID=UPI00161EDE5D|nr:dihydroxyacetone kinase subunit DhaL [Saccharothrix violaceirubra]
MECRAAVLAVAAVVAAHRDELVELDRVIGDGDHGENLRRGFAAAVSTVDGSGPVLRQVATLLISKVGGAAGPLYGTGFLRAAGAVEGRPLDGFVVASALAAALEGVVALGKAAVGDKTMVDALAPAVAAAESAAASGGSVAAVLEAAAVAAAEGAASTVPLVARKGRAAYLGARSAGHLDPGARSTALVLRAFADAAR